MEDQRRYLLPLPFRRASQPQTPPSPDRAHSHPTRGPRPLPDCLRAKSTLIPPCIPSGNPLLMEVGEGYSCWAEGSAPAQVQPPCVTGDHPTPTPNVSNSPPTSKLATVWGEHRGSFNSVILDKGKQLPRASKWQKQV